MFSFFSLQPTPLTSHLEPHASRPERFRVKIVKRGCVLRPAVNWLHYGYRVGLSENRALTVMLLLSLITSVFLLLLEQETLQVV